MFIPIALTCIDMRAGQEQLKEYIHDNIGRGGEFRSVVMHRSDVTTVIYPI